MVEQRTNSPTNTPDDWRFLADRDLAIAVHLAENMRPIPAEHIAFLCQQAVEKFLKGILVILGDEPPYTHDLPELCKLIEKHRSSFVSISSLSLLSALAFSVPFRLTTLDRNRACHICVTSSLLTDFSGCFFCAFMLYFPHWSDL